MATFWERPETKREFVSGDKEDNILIIYLFIWCLELFRILAIPDNFIFKLPSKITKETLIMVAWLFGIYGIMVIEEEKIEKIILLSLRSSECYYTFWKFDFWNVRLLRQSISDFWT